MAPLLVKQGSRIGASLVRQVRLVSDPLSPIPTLPFQTWINVFFHMLLGINAKTTTNKDNNVASFIGGTGCSPLP